MATLYNHKMAGVQVTELGNIIAVIQCMFCSAFFYLTLLFLISWTLKTKDMYRHEIMCTGNTAQITFKCFYSLKTARNFVRDVIIRTLVPKFVRILTKLSPSILLILDKCPGHPHPECIINNL